jgi:hypothetical protein
MPLGTEQAFAALPSGTAGGRVVASPFQWLFTGEDNLRIVVVNAVVGVVVTVTGRFIGLDQVIQAFQFTIVPTSDRLPTTLDERLGTGYLLNLSVVASAGGPLVGQTYCMVRIIRGLSGATLVLGTLLGGYVTAQQHLAYPGSPIESSIAGGGVIRTIGGTQPAPGIDLVETVPTGARWEILIVSSQLQTDATPPTRIALLRTAASGVPVGYFPTTRNIAASSGLWYQWAPGMNGEIENVPSGVSLAAIPPTLILVAGGVFATLTANLQMGDTWGVPYYTVREWLEAA